MEKLKQVKERNRDREEASKNLHEPLDLFICT